MNQTDNISSKHEIYVGIDVDAKSYAVTYQNRRREGKSFKMPASEQQLYQYFNSRFPDKQIIFAYEAGGTGYCLHDYLASQNQNCIMVHPASIKKAPKDRVKTNRIDSQKLSDQLLSGEIKGIRIPSEDYRHLRQLVDIRQQYVRASTKTKQRIKALLLFEGINVPPEFEGANWGGQFKLHLREIALTLKPVPELKLTALLDELEHQHERTLWSCRCIKKFCQEHESIRKNIEYLRSIPGIGFIVASYVLAQVGDPENLCKLNELGSFAGVVPSEYSTGEGVNRGRITHMGDRTLRHLLVEAAWIAIRKDQHLAQFYHRLKNKHFKHGAQIAIVAVARKLTQRIYRVLKDQRNYIVH